MHNDPLFILYTSGSTANQKEWYIIRVVICLRSHDASSLIFDYHDGDIYWCTADVGWITGHTYGVYGPLANGATTVIV